MVHHKSVLIRSTPGWFEPRFRFAVDFLAQSFGPPACVTWSRTVSDKSVHLSDSRNTFNIKAGYGRGYRNLIHHIAFFFFVFRRLLAIKPNVIYACDLDTLIPALLWRLNKKCLIIYDQFDPLSGRTTNLLLSIIVNWAEYKLSIWSDIQITANKMRVPEKIRESWFEVKNIFPINSTSTLPKSSLPLTLFYGGVLNVDRGLLSCAEAVSKERHWEFHLYGQGELSEELTSRKFSNVFVHQPVPHDELMTIAKNCDLCLAMYDPSLIHNKFTASNKLFESAQLRLPILTNDGTSIGSFTVKYGLGWSVKYNNIQEIRRALREARNSSLSERSAFAKNLISFYNSQKLVNDAEIARVRFKVHALLESSL